MKNLANPILSLMFGARKESSSSKDDPSTTTASIGTVWCGREALKAYKSGDLCSNPAGKPIRICFRHLIDDDNVESDEKMVVVPHKKARREKKSVWVSWVDEHRALHTFRKIEPMRRSSVDSLTATEKDHIELSFLGHAFVFVVRETDNDDDDDGETTWDIKSIDEATIIGGYRPQRLATDVNVDDDDYPCHVLEISQQGSASGLCMFCQPTKKKASSDDFPLVLREGKRLEPLVTADKKYTKENIIWWPVYLENDVFGKDKKLREPFKQDLDYALKCLPHHAYQSLKDAKTDIYLNKTFQSGPKIRPSRIKGACYHPDKEWLVNHGFKPEKAGCIEIYDIDNYMEDRELWGRGGLLIHELAHAYHKKCVKDGYGNAEIIACYEKAMEEGLYDMVKVHGPQGPKARAYACNNACEYFAELSTAFLGGKKDFLGEILDGRKETDEYVSPRVMHNLMDESSMLHSQSLLPSHVLLQIQQVVPLQSRTNQRARPPRL